MIKNNNITILYVEDDELLRDELQLFIKRFAKKLYVANDGLEGLEYYKKYNPDIVVSDIKMPNMNGIDMVKEIKEIDPNQYVIYTTAHSESCYFIDAINMQVNGFILKPVDYDQLRDKIVELTSNIELKEKLNLANDRFELAMQSTKDGIWDWDPNTNEVYFSKTWKTMLGYNKDKINSDFKEWSSRVHPDDIENAMKDINNHLDGKTEVYENIHRIKHKNGSWIWVNARGKALFDKDNKPYRVIGFQTDITLQKIKEDQDKKKDILILEQTKNAQMGEMIGNIAHQWRQPLNMISTSASGIKLAKQFNTITDDKMFNMLDNMIKSTKFLSNTIDVFRDYLKEKKELKETILQDRIIIAIHIIEASLKNNHISLINNIQNIEPIKITMVAGELSQVIINLLNNAKDAIIDNKIENGCIKVDLVKEKNKVIISIEDNGGGIPLNILDNVFDTYFTTKDENHGTGLGLHMCKEIIEKHLKGKIYVKNIDNGAKFFIELNR